MSTSPRGSEGPASFSTVVVAAALRSWKTWRVNPWFFFKGHLGQKNPMTSTFAATFSYHESLRVRNLLIVPNSTSTTCFWEVHHNFKQNMAVVDFLCQAGQTVVLQLGHWIWIWPAKRHLTYFFSNSGWWSFNSSLPDSQIAMTSSMTWQLQVQNWKVESFKPGQPDVMNPSLTSRCDRFRCLVDVTNFWCCKSRKSPQCLKAMGMFPWECCLSTLWGRGLYNCCIRSYNMWNSDWHSKGCWRVGILVLLS